MKKNTKLVFLGIVAIVAVWIVYGLVRRRKEGYAAHRPKLSKLAKRGGGGWLTTNYYVAEEGKNYLMDCGQKPLAPESVPVKGKIVKLGSAPGGKKYALRGENGQPLINQNGRPVLVDAWTWDACYCEGTCRVGNNTYHLNKEAKGNVKRTVVFTQTPGQSWGIGSQDNQLEPYISITSEKKSDIGKKFILPYIKDKKLPSGEIHNGCVRVDDVCGDGCQSNQTDFFVGTHRNSRVLQEFPGFQYPDRGPKPYESPNCELKKYQV